MTLRQSRGEAGRVVLLRENRLFNETGGQVTSCFSCSAGPRPTQQGAQVLFDQTSIAPIKAQNPLVCFLQVFSQSVHRGSWSCFGLKDWAASVECVKQEAVFTASLYWPCRWSSCLLPEGTPGSVVVVLQTGLGLQITFLGSGSLKGFYWVWSQAQRTDIWSHTQWIPSQHCDNRKCWWNPERHCSHQFWVNWFF